MRLPPTTNPALLWTGRILSGLVVLFLTFDAVTKFVKVAPVVEATQNTIPRTAVLGAILLTGYLGGAAASHVIAGSGAFPIGFSILFGVLAWTGLVLRNPRLLSTILLGRSVSA